MNLVIKALDNRDSPNCSDCYNDDNKFVAAGWDVNDVRVCLACLLRRLGRFLGSL